MMTHVARAAAVILLASQAAALELRRARAVAQEWSSYGNFGHTAELRQWLRGAQEVHGGKLVDLDLTGSADITPLVTQLQSALASEAYAAVRFRTPAWQLSVPSDMVEEPPYKDMYRRLNATHGEYIAQEHSVFVSANDASFLIGAKFGSREELGSLGFGERTSGFAPRRCDEATARANVAAKHVVMQVDFPECGFFGHAVDNVFPRIIPVVRAAKKAGHKVSVVIPERARARFSRNTQELFQQLGIELLLKAPATPHRAVGVALVGTWDRHFRKAFRDDLRTAIMDGEAQAQCRGGGGADPKRLDVWLSRRHGARNGHNVGHEREVDEAVAKAGFAVIDDPAALSIGHLAKRLYGSACSLSGFAGTGMLNLVFMPDDATVIEYNPFRIYADYWQWANALGLHYAHGTSKISLDDKEIERLVSFVVSASGRQNRTRA